jgi:hypothetical protein
LNFDDLKKKLRELKRFEIETRFKGQLLTGKEDLVWNRFFSTRSEYDTSVKYPMNYIILIDKQNVKEIFSEFFCMVYFKYYQENGITHKNLYSPELLSMLGLPPDSTANDIKKQFRELAKKYHPDCGGDSEKFIEMLEVYHKLTDNNN